MSRNAAASPPDLARFRAVQRLAFQCAEEVAAGLRPGVTEREAAGRLRRLLRASGVDDWFHVPFAWFGDRTAFRGVRAAPRFFPTGRELADGMPFILDCAPVVDGWPADIGYSGCAGSNPVWARVDADLAGYRALILDAVRARKPLDAIYREVDALIIRQGYRNRHRRYPGRVIGHRVVPVRSRLPSAAVGGFGLRTLHTLGRELTVDRARSRSPLWSGGRGCAHPPTPGLWAVEPHIALGGVGVKFEELLVVTEDDAFWLDDDVPHVRRWRAAGATAAQPAEVQA